MKKMKRFLTALLTLAMLVTAMPMNVLAAVAGASDAEGIVLQADELEGYSRLGGVVQQSRVR